ncbi:60S ribosomal subunit assembly/export protein loc1 [Viridothelium virens]|uniref:60S ribosomal subunit assembly/export protein loc1 n=1 Tax=Viridothelium virens TaxID=1048519 RepID=A0A6A6H3H4_VIRVR|nr:60S ribosomal subunit assembly/export protein loc1 [Viridothelium virens]
MAPTKVKAGSAKGNNKRHQKPSSSGSSSKNKQRASISKATKQLKTKSAPTPSRKKRRSYTDEELGIPKLNMITPAGVQKPRGKKKGKVFVDDKESMMTILAMVNAEKEGQIESKLMKARQMQEIREARQKEAEARQEEKRSKLEETKDSIKRRRKRKPDSEETLDKPEDTPKHPKMNRKRVSFG